MSKWLLLLEISNTCNVPTDLEQLDLVSLVFTKLVYDGYISPRHAFHFCSGLEDCLRFKIKSFLFCGNCDCFSSCHINL